SLDIGPRAREDWKACMPDLEVHRQRRAQIRKTRMDLARYRTAMRARDAIGREHAGFGMEFVERFGDRQRVPYAHPLKRPGVRESVRRGQMLYSAFQAWSDMMAPSRWAAASALASRDAGLLPWGNGELSRRLFAVLDVYQGAKVTHDRPDYAIASVLSGNAVV